MVTIFKVGDRVSFPINNKNQVYDNNKVNLKNFPIKGIGILINYCNACYYRPNCCRIGITDNLSGASQGAREKTTEYKIDRYKIDPKYLNFYYLHISEEVLTLVEKQKCQICQPKLKSA